MLSRFCNDLCLNAFITGSAMVTLINRHTVIKGKARIIFYNGFLIDFSPPSGIWIFKAKIHIRKISYSPGAEICSYARKHFRSP